jgi:hypothetical protein
VYAKRIGVGEFGQFCDSLRLPPGSPPGEYRLQVTGVTVSRHNKGQEEHLLDGIFLFQVASQVKTPFSLSVATDREIQWAENSVKVTIKGQGRAGVEVGLPVIVKWYEADMVPGSSSDNQGGGRLLYILASKRGY